VKSDNLSTINQIKMTLKYSVGLDVSSKDIKAAICTIDLEQRVKVVGTKTIANTQSGFVALQDWIGRKRRESSVPLSICMEATGVYHENCSLYFHMKEFRVSIILPNKAKKYLESLGIKSKNDSIDAKGLAQMGAEQVLKQWEPMNGFFHTLRGLTRHYQSLQEQKTVAIGQLHAHEHGMATDKFIAKQLKARIQFLEKQVAAVLRQINTHIASEKEVAQRIDRICAIKGLSTLSVSTVVAEVGGFELFSSYKQLVSYAGYDVVENQSGKRIGKTKISKKGNSRIRRILHMPAFRAVSCKEPVLLSLYQRTFARHGIKMKSYVAVQKKLLLMIYYLWKNDTVYDKNHFMNNIQEQEQKPLSGSLPKTEKEVAPLEGEATQGKHPTNNRSMPPLGKTKLKKTGKLLAL